MDETPREMDQNNRLADACLLAGSIPDVHRAFRFIIYAHRRATLCFRRRVGAGNLRLPFRRNESAGMAGSLTIPLCMVRRHLRAGDSVARAQQLDLGYCPRNSVLLFESNAKQAWIATFIVRQASRLSPIVSTRKTKKWRHAGCLSCGSSKFLDFARKFVFPCACKWNHNRNRWTH